MIEVAQNNILDMIMIENKGRMMCMNDRDVVVVRKQATFRVGILC